MLISTEAHMRKSKTPPQLFVLPVQNSYWDNILSSQPANMNLVQVKAKDTVAPLSQENRKAPVSVWYTEQAHPAVPTAVIQCFVQSALCMIL